MELVLDIIRLCFFVWVASKIFHAYELLNGLSDDINDIKKKLELPTSIRTPRQNELSFKESLKEAVYQGADLKETGYTKNDLKKYKDYIIFITNQRQNAKYCPDCWKFFDGGYKKKCDICEGDLVLVKDIWKGGVCSCYHHKEGT